MKTKVNITLEMEDEDEAQHFISWIQQHSNVIDSRIFPNVEHLKENTSYKNLVKAKRQAGLELDRFINQYK